MIMAAVGARPMRPSSVTDEDADAAFLWRLYANRT